MRNLTLHELFGQLAEQLPARELMGRAGFPYTAIAIAIGNCNGNAYGSFDSFLNGNRNGDHHHHRELMGSLCNHKGHRYDHGSFGNGNGNGNGNTYGSLVSFLNGNGDGNLDGNHQYQGS